MSPKITALFYSDNGMKETSTGILNHESKKYTFILNHLVLDPQSAADHSG